MNCDNHLFPHQTFKLFEKQADLDREIQVSETQRREESTCVPPAIQELEVATAAHEETEEQSTGAAQMESSPLDAGAVMATPAASEATVSPRPDSSSSGSGSGGGGSGGGGSGSGGDPRQLGQGHQAAAASTNSAEE